MKAPVSSIIAGIIYVAVFQLPFPPGVAKAQTGLQSQPQDNSDPCGNRGYPHMTTSQMESCRLDAIHAPPKHVEYQFKWLLAAAEHYSHRYEYELADIYARRPSIFDNDAFGLPPKNLVEAYKWAEIGAAITGQYVRRLPPRVSPEDNSANIKQRDEIAKSMTPDEIRRAQTAADQWLAGHANAISRYLAWATCTASSCPEEPVW